EVSPDQLLIRLHSRQRARPGTGRDDDMLRGVIAWTQGTLWCFRFARLDGDLAAAFQRGIAPYDLDLVLLHEKADAVVEPLCDGTRSLHNGLVVKSLPLG